MSPNPSHPLQQSNLKPPQADITTLIDLIPLETRRRQYIDFYPGENLKDKNPIKFDYQSEYHLVSVLQHLNVPWRYKSVNFPLEIKGNEVIRLIPSIYLPIQGLFIKVCLEEEFSEKLEQKDKLKKIDPNIKIELIIKNSLYELMYKQIVNTGDTIQSVESSKKGFAHPSEREFAMLLNECNVLWRYEPVVFPLEWDDNRRATESFSPDFHLPKYDLYLEMTTMRQSLATKKNGKIRKFREIYPNERLVVLYGRDIKELKEMGILNKQNF